MKLDETAPASSGFARVGGRALLQTANHTVPNRYKVSWSGLRDTHTTEPTVITLRVNQGDCAVALYFEGDRLRVITADEDEYPRLNFSTNQAHEVSITLNMTSRPTVEVDIWQGNVPLFTTQPKGMLESNFRGSDALDINVLSSETAYRLSNLSATTPL